VIDMKIKKGDKIQVICGKSRGKTGSVLTVKKEERRIVVEGVNVIRRHTKPRRKGEKGQIIEKNAPLALSNVVLICPKCAKPTKVMYFIDEAKRKFRQCKKCKAMIS
jgi:large subunit ribosomal protein L24